jgi:Amt family ammonium transporter
VIVWFSVNKLSHRGIFKKVDDTLGVVHTHGIAGLIGGILVGFFADPRMVEYLGVGQTPNASYAGLLYGHPGQVLIQLGAGATIIVFDGVMTFIILKLIGVVIPLRMTDEELQEGDLALHAEEVYAEAPAIGARLTSSSLESRTRSGA